MIGDLCQLIATRFDFDQRGDTWGEEGVQYVTQLRIVQSLTVAVKTRRSVDWRYGAGAGGNGRSGWTGQN